MLVEPDLVCGDEFAVAYVSAFDVGDLQQSAVSSQQSEVSSQKSSALIPKLSGSRGRAGDDEVEAHTRSALKRLAIRYQQLDEEITTYDTDLAQLVGVINPALVQTKGIATITAGQLLITAGDNPERLRSEAAFAMLCGAAALPGEHPFGDIHGEEASGERVRSPPRRVYQ